MQKQIRATTPAEAFWTLDPFALINPGDPWHSDVEARFSPSRYGLVSQLTRRLTPNPAAPPYVHVGVVGHRGSGKTTQVRKAMAELAPCGVHAISVDALTAFDQSNLSFADVMLVIASCSQSTQPTPGATSAAAIPAVTSKTFVFGIAQNPVGGCDGTQIVLFVTVGNCPVLVQESLIRWDDKTKTLQPSLAESWTYEGTSATFKLRSNVKFQDGTPFNADAVVFNYRRVWDATFDANKDVKFPYAPRVPFKSVEKVDDKTVKVTFTTSRSDTMLLMTTAPALIQSPTAVQKMNAADYTFKAVGTGPFKIASYQDNARIELERNDDYWGAKPAATRVILVVKQDASALVNDLLSGAIDAMRDPSIEQIDQIKGRGL